jgi:hypothetical protein
MKELSNERLLADIIGAPQISCGICGEAIGCWRRLGELGDGAEARLGCCVCLCLAAEKV